MRKIKREIRNKHEKERMSSSGGGSRSVPKSKIELRALEDVGRESFIKKPVAIGGDRD